MRRYLYSIALCLVVTGNAQAQWGRSAPAEPEVEKGVVPVLSVGGLITERHDPLMLFGPPSTTLHELVRTVEKAKNDDQVHALVVKFEDPMWGMAQAREFGRALFEFRDSEKPVYAYFDTASINTYLAASSADEMISSPAGIVDLHGVNFSLYFFRDLLAKLGLEADVVNTGRYKNAMEPFTHSEMSDGTREQMTALLDEIFADFRARLANNRDIEESEAENLLTGGPYSSRTALKIGVIDRVGYLPDLLDEIAEDTDKELTFDVEYTASPKSKVEMPSLFSIFSGGPSKGKKTSAGDKVAVVYALGGIVDGRVDKSNPFVQENVIASEDFLELLDEVASEPGLKALVLRVDSPGGSAIASDRIWNRLKGFQENDIPVIVSMGNIAASGGYYISMGADKIVAEPTTITGSIGVVGGKLALGGTYDKVGIRKQSLRIGENSNIFDEEEMWSDREKEILNVLLEDIYDEFTTKAAEGRGMEIEALRELGEGRIWSGYAAREKGLVDKLGGLQTAIDLAREMADAGEANVVEFPKELTIMEAIEKMFSGETSMSAPRQGLSIHPALQAAELIIPRVHLNHALFIIENMKEGPTAMLVMPYLPQVE